MEIELRSLLIGSFVGAFLASATWMALTTTVNVTDLDMDIARLIVTEARAECVDNDRPFRIAGAGGYITAGCDK